MELFELLLFEGAEVLAEVVKLVKVLPPAKRRELIRSLKRETESGGSSK